MRILSVNVGASRPITIKHRTVQTGIYKQPLAGPVPVTRFGLQNDVRIEPRKMGLEHSAVYAYPHEHYAYWQNELGREPFPPGQFGENLTVSGLLEEEVRIGDVFRFGSAVLQVSHPRIPCAKLNERMGLRFASRFLASRKVGFYLRVLSEGNVAQGDPIELLERDENSPTVEEFVRVTQYEFWDVVALQRLLQARDLMPAWRETIEEKLARARAASGWQGLREFEVTRREDESADTVSLYLKCARGRALAPFHGGQRLMVVLDAHTSNQRRQAYPLSGDPHDLSSYRITLRHQPDPDDAESAGTVSSHLAALAAGAHIQCGAPHGAPLLAPEPARDERISVLLCQGLGIAPMLSLLYELAGRHTPQVCLFHQPGAHDAQGLLREVHTLLRRNPGFRMMPLVQDRPAAEQIRQCVPLAQAAIAIAGSPDFSANLVRELAADGVAGAALASQNLD